MTVKVLEKEGYKISFIASLIAIGIGVVAMICTFIIWAENSISIGSMQIRQITILVIAGLVCPAIIFVLSFLGDKKILKGKIIPLIFGIIFIAIGALVIVFSAVYINIVMGFVADGDLMETGALVVLYAMFYLAMVVMGAIVYAGIQEILYWKENK